MKKLNCIVHYADQTSYHNIKKLSQTNIDKIRKTKIKREEIGGDHLHENQISQIPNNIDLEIHGVHLEPCYKR